MDTRDSVRLHFFYGVACTGKSTLALHVAQNQGIRTIIHTDYVREVQRLLVKPDQSHPLAKVTHTAWELFGEYSQANIIQGFTSHVHAVLPALLAVGQKLSGDGFDAIVEGVHCYSEVLGQFTHIGGLMVLPNLLVVTNEARLLGHIQRKESARASSGERKSWKEHIQTLLIIQNFLLQDAIQHHIPIIDMGKE